VRCHITDVGRDMVRYVAGIEFVDLPPHADAAIALYLENLRREREADRGAGG